ncbi:M56 family metallopeptidase [Taibaiella koreensis]|uniref:M56 family metallopeptidase n=1 Tax=Taibaiella koreensis TaxID=1268548 RepID=UPI000E5A0443|nr:M56 family metallopeptidase [Taibaiella koreensis]
MSVLFVLLKINIVLTGGYLLYRYGLRRLTFFRLNRIFLLGILLAAAVAPFVSFTLVRPVPEMLQTISLSTTAMHLSPAPSVRQTGFSWISATAWLYAAGSGAVAAIFLLQAVSLFALYRQSNKMIYRCHRIRIVPGNRHPFSSFGNIFLDPMQHSETDLTLILQHEQAHIQQEHSIDMLLGMLCRIACWCNPVSWLLDKAIRSNLEFLADEAVLHSGAKKQLYQYSLLHTAAGYTPAGLGHPFNTTHLKSRIHMMNKPRSSAIELSRYGLALSIFTALLLAVSLSFGQQKNQVKSILPQQPKVVKKTGHPAKPVTASTKKRQNRNRSDRRKYKQTPETQAGTTSYSQATNNTFELNVELNPGVASVNLKTPATNERPLLVVDGKIDNVTSLQAIPTDRVASITILKDETATAQYGEAGRNGVIQVTMKQ